MNLRPRLYPCAFAITLCSVAPSFATSATWLPATGGDWFTPTNWSTNPAIPNGIGDIATLSGNNAAQSNVSLNSNITLGTLNLDIDSYALSGSGSINFQVPSGAASFTINNSNTVFRNVLNFSLALPHFTMASPLVLTYNASTTPQAANLASLPALSGDQPITIDGTGALIESNASTNTSLLTVNGTFIARSNNSFGSATGSDSDQTVINSGGTVVITAHMLGTEKITLAGGTLASESRTSTLPVFSGNISVTADSELTWWKKDQSRIMLANCTLNGIISGAANLTVSGTRFTATAANTLSGHVILAGGGMLTIPTTGSFLNVPEFNATAGTLDLSRPAGSNPALNSVQPHSVSLAGGTLLLSTDLEPTQFLNPNSTGGALLFNTANATAGGTNLIDLSPYHAPIQIVGSIAASVTLVPDSISHTLYLGGGSIYAPLHDVGGNPTNLAILSGDSVLEAANTYSGSTAVAAGATLELGSVAFPSGNSIHNDGTLALYGNTTFGQLTGLGSLVLANNVSLALAPTPAAAMQSSLSLGTGAQLDLGSTPLIIQVANATLKSSVLTQLTSEVNTGRNGGVWNGPGITSSTVASDPAQFAIALADNALLHLSTFHGQPVDANSLLLVPTFFGDANLDGTVDLSDLSTLLNHFGQQSPNWTDGNFDNQPTIDLTDLSDILNNFGLTSPTPARSPITNSQLRPTPAPEPASALLLAPALLVRRKRQRR